MLRVVIFLFLLANIPNCFAGFRFDGDYQENVKFLYKEAQYNSLKIFWWNVAWGSLNQHTDLEENLYSLSSGSYAPDVLALGEYKEAVLTVSLRRHLDKIYPYSTFQKYSPSSKVGIIVYSKFPITKYVGGNLDWTPTGASAAERSHYKSNYLAATSHAKHWERPFFFVRLKKEGVEYDIVPSHLLSPYAGMVDVDGYFETINQAARSSTNPLGYQIKRLKAHLQANFGLQYLKRRFILIGDFNIRDSMLGIRPAMFTDLWTGMKRVTIEGGDTYPTSRAKNDLGQVKSTFLSGKIDHAFISPLISVRRGRTLKMRGSDHYPIYVIVY